MAPTRCMRRRDKARSGPATGVLNWGGPNRRVSCPLSFGNSSSRRWARPTASSASSAAAGCRGSSWRSRRPWAGNVVVKVLLPELAAGVSVDRFRREIQLAAQLQHPAHRAPPHRRRVDGLPYFTMPFVDGESLRARLSATTSCPCPRRSGSCATWPRALDYAHAQGVVHRDIKPDNVLLTHGVAVVTDFGVAKALSVSAAAGGQGHAPGLTTMGVALGTPTYMAPEQASADPAMDHRVDVYAFGVMAYEMLAGQPPFTGRTPQALLGAHLVALPEPVTMHRPGAAARARLARHAVPREAPGRPAADGGHPDLGARHDDDAERRDDPGAGTHGRPCGGRGAAPGRGRGGSCRSWPESPARRRWRVDLVVADGRNAAARAAVDRRREPGGADLARSRRPRPRHRRPTAPSRRLLRRRSPTARAAPEPGPIGGARGPGAAGAPSRGRARREAAGDGRGRGARADRPGRFRARARGVAAGGPAHGRGGGGVLGGGGRVG